MGFNGTHTLQFCLFHSFSIFCYGEGVYHCLDVAAEESVKVMRGIAYAMVRHTALREVVCAYLGRTVACRDKCLAAACYVIEILLVLLIIDVCAQSCKGALLVLWLVTRLRTFDEYLFRLTRIWIFPHIAGANA